MYLKGNFNKSRLEMLHQIGLAFDEESKPLALDYA